MHLVVCHDVVADHRRALLHKRLSGYLRPVQKSVFEGELPPGLHPALLEAIGQVIDRATDTVRIYHLCGACSGLTELLGTSLSVPEGPEDVVV